MGCGLFWAILLIFIGLWIWASNYGIVFFSFYRDWPVIFVLLGILIIHRIIKRRR
ncbi:MAG: LiaI-LiaF-like domain-containing protein [bacterium]